MEFYTSTYFYLKNSQHNLWITQIDKLRINEKGKRIIDNLLVWIKVSIKYFNLHKYTKTKA